MESNAFVLEKSRRSAFSIIFLITYSIMLFMSESAYLSVVDLTSSLFHKPHVNSLAVSPNNMRLTNKRVPIGPKKNVNFSISPGTKEDSVSYVYWC